jgi:chromosomal replication initiation ATPase DnaA
MTPCEMTKDPTVLAGLIGERHGTTAVGVLGRRRGPRFLEARRELYAALRAWGWSYPAIGRFVGRDHTTVLQVLARRGQ